MHRRGYQLKVPQQHGIVAKGQLLIAKFPKCAKSTGIKVSGKNTQKANHFYILIFGAGSYSICNVGSCWLLHHFSKRKREINTFSLARIAQCRIRYSKKRKKFARRTIILWEAFKRNLQKNNLDQPVGLQELRKWFLSLFFIFYWQKAITWWRLWLHVQQPMQPYLGAKKKSTLMND